MTKLLILAVIVAAVVLWMKYRQTVERRSLLSRPIDPAVLTTVVTLLAGGAKLRAIGQLRGTGLGMAAARALAEAIQSGHRPPTTDGSGLRFDEQRLPDLASRVRALRRDGLEQEAVHLVCSETGMRPDDARAFVQNLH